MNTKTADNTAKEDDHVYELIEPEVSYVIPLPCTPHSGNSNLSCTKINAQNEHPQSGPYYSNMDCSAVGEGYLEPIAFVPPPYDEPPKYQEIAIVHASTPVVVIPSSYSNATYNENKHATPNNPLAQLQVIKNGLTKDIPEHVEKSNDFQSVI